MSVLDLTVDSCDSDEVEETVRVFWTPTMKMHHMSICVEEPLEKMFEELADIYKTSKEFIRFLMNDEPVNTWDSLQSLGFRVALDNFYASVVTTKAVSPLLQPGNGRIPVKCLVKDHKKPLQYHLHPKDQLAALFRQVSTDLSVPVDQLRVKFDGDVVQPTDTPQSLELEGDECFDVFISPNGGGTTSRPPNPKTEPSNVTIVID